MARRSNRLRGRAHVEVDLCFTLPYRQCDIVFSKTKEETLNQACRFGANFAASEAKRLQRRKR